jgi:hypothetical protein
MRRIVTTDKKGKKKLVNVPSWDNIYVNNQMGQPAYDVSISSNGDGDGDGTPAPIVLLNATSYTGSGTIWPDTSGNGYDATLYNSPTYNSTYFSFDNTSTKYANVSSIGDLNNWTIEAWFRVTAALSTKEATAVVTTLYDVPGVLNTGVINYVIGSSSGYSDDLMVGFFDGAWHQCTPFIPTLNTWYQVMGTYDGSVIKQYVNGVLNSSLNYVGVSSANGGDIRIARRWDGPVNTIHYFPGDVGIVRIYDTALDSSQVSTNFDEFRTVYGI